MQLTIPHQKKQSKGVTFFVFGWYNVVIDV